MKSAFGCSGKEKKKQHRGGSSRLGVSLVME